MDTDRLKYPIGRYKRPDVITGKEIASWIDEIAVLPLNFRGAIQGLSEHQLDAAYRDGGWTLRQVIHHVPDSHMNAYVRFKLALTEDNPIIKPYLEDKWARLQDAQSTPVEISLTMLDALHMRWVALMKSMKPDDFKRTYFHPDQNKKSDLETVLGLYAWHGKHHLAHVASLRERMNW